MFIVVLILAFCSASLAFVAYLFTPSGRELDRRGLLFSVGILPLTAAGLAIPNFANPDLRFFLSIPIMLAYSFLGVVLVSYVRNRAPTRHLTVLVLPLLGATAILIAIWGWTDSCAFGVCV